MTALFLFFCKKIYPLPDFSPKNYNSLKFWGFSLIPSRTYHLIPSRRYHLIPSRRYHPLRGSPYAVRLPPPWEGDQGGGAAEKQVRSPNPCFPS